MSKESATGRPKDALDTHLGTRALHDKLITPDQLKEALSIQARDLAERKTGVRTLGAILVSRGYLTPAQLQSLILTEKKAGEIPPTTAPFGKYRLVRELGRGGMGIVYEAIDSALGRKVALKTMILSPLANPKDAQLDEERFLREAQLSAALPKHPHIVGVYEVGVIEKRRYLAMELIDGKPMSEWREERSITLRQEIEVLRDVALAVHHAHEQDVIHRDLKPQNILIDAKNEPHVTDFGLAKMVGENLSVSLTGAGMVVGTPAYISPEQAQGLKTTDRRTDVYALGVMLFETITGRHPFTGQTAMEILMKASKNPVPSASGLMKVRLSPAQTKGLDDICQKALAKKMVDRYRDAAAFAADLTKWLKGEEVKVLLQTRRMGAAPKPKWPVAAGIVAALAVLVVVLVQVLSVPRVDYAEQERKRAEERKREADLKEEREKAAAEREKAAADRRAVEERAKAAENELKAMQTRLLKAVEVRHPASLSAGLIGEYFGGVNFDTLSLRRIDPEIKLTVKYAPAWPNGATEMLSVRWRGYLRVPETGPYLFYLWTHDGVRLFIDNVEIVANWTTKKVTLETGIAFLEQGYHEFAMEAFESEKVGGVHLSWKKGNDAGAVEAGPPAFFHDPSKFAPFNKPVAKEKPSQESVPGAQEAETLPILEAAPESHFVLPFGRKKGILIWGKHPKLGDRLKLGFDSPESGEKTLILAMTRVKNAGTFRIAVNGTVIAKELDLYHPGLLVLEHEFKKVALRKGQNELEFTVVGTDPRAVEWNKGEGVMKLSLDYLRFR